MIVARIFHKDNMLIDFKLEEYPIKIGRSSSADIIIDDNLLSRIHFLIFFDMKNQKIIFKDLNSKNGSFLGSISISSARLRINDVVYFGSHKLLLVEENMNLKEKFLIGRTANDVPELDFSKSKKK